VKFTSPLFLWLPLLAVAAHLVEEFVWPGGFARWYRAYRPERAASVTVGLLVAVNVVLVAMAFVPPLLGRTAAGVAWWLVVAAVGAANACFHLWATARTRTYSPGVVTGTLLYLPLAALGAVELVAPGRASVLTAAQAVAAGVGYHLWSAWNHRRRAAASRG
jgi:hypothetical protein